jgi:transglutaminase-like putative cysteine protease
MKRLLLYLLCSVLLHAARPPDWLQLPAANDPRPAGASAWILHDAMRITQERPDELVFRHRHAVMPLSEIGVENAVCALEYTAGAESLVSAQAWAMSPDGKQCRAFGGRDFVIVSPTVSNWTWDLTKSVLFLAQRYLQPGWIFAWEVEIKSTATAFDIHWSPRNALPVRVASLDLLPMEEGVVKWKAFSKDLPAPMPGNAASALAWRIVDLPGYDRNVPTGIEPNSMELRAYLAASPTETKTWSDVVRLVRAEMDPKAILTPALDAEAHRLVGTGDFWSRIQPVCRFVQKEITYLSITIDSDSMAGFRPHPASEVWENRYGDCKDKAVLLCTMLGAIGIEARVMLVNSGAPMRNVIDWPSAVFNHAIVAVPCREAPPAGATTVQVGGRDYVVFDPTNEDVPFGLVPNYDTGGLGLVLAPGVSAPVTIPQLPSPTETISSKINTTVAEDGSAAIEISEERFGVAAAEAIARDEAVPLAERTGALEERIQRRVPLISDLTWESTADAPAHHWTCKANFSAQFLGKRIPGGIYVATDLLSAVPSAEPWEEESEGWFNFTPGATRREIQVSAPAGWEFADVPPDWSARTAAGEGSMHYSNGTGIVKGEMRLRIEGGVLDRKAYLLLRDLLRLAVAAERRPLMLHRIKPAIAPAGTAAPAPH